MTDALDMEGAKRGTAAKKEAVLTYLKAADWDGLRKWAVSERNPGTALLGSFFNEDEEMRLRAIQGTALVMGDLYRTKPKKVVKIIERLFGQMDRDAAGSIWNAPEAIGEILLQCPELMNKFAMALFSYLREDPFERGVHFAAMRIAKARPDLVGKLGLMLEGSLLSGDVYIRAFAAAALLSIGRNIPEEQLRQLQAETESIRIYDPQSARLVETRVAALLDDIPG